MIILRFFKNPVLKTIIISGFKGAILSRGFRSCGMYAVYVCSCQQLPTYNVLCKVPEDRRPQLCRNGGLKFRHIISTINVQIPY
jgi:hypothetical protein